MFDLERDRFAARLDPGKISREQIEEAALSHGRREGLTYSVAFLSKPLSPQDGHEPDSQSRRR